MRASNWSATSAIAAPSQLGIRYGSVARAAAVKLRAAADSGDHYGAHYSLALLYKLYPSLVAPDASPETMAAAGAARLCAAERATVAKLAKGAAGRAAAAAVTMGCTDVEVVTDWPRAAGVATVTYVRRAELPFDESPGAAAISTWIVRGDEETPRLGRAASGTRATWSWRTSGRRRTARS